jgi:hypothetical protein
MQKKNNLISYYIYLGAASVILANACTKTSAKSQNPLPSTPQVPSTSGPNTVPSPAGGGNSEAALLRSSIVSLAGERVFCQNFSTANQLFPADLESIANGMAGAQANLPAGLPNPFSVQTLALNIKPKICESIPELLSAGHCALSLSKQVATGTVSVQTEQRLLWKDVSVLAQATSVKASLDGKTSALATKNAIFASLQKQVSQQRLLLQILQGTSGNAGLFTEAQALLANLQEQTTNLESDIKGLEAELKPIQDELTIRIDELNTARAALKLACNPAGMGAASASWKEN